MISKGRYGYHLDDIAEIQRKPRPLNSVDEMRLAQMLAEVAEYEDANEIPRTQTCVSKTPPLAADAAAGVVSVGATCRHGNVGYCGFCSTGTNPSRMTST